MSGNGATQTRRFRALGFDFAVRTPDPALTRYLDRLFLPFASDGAPRHVYEIGERASRYEVSFDREQLLATERPQMALAYVLWHVNRRVVEETADRLLVHAAAAEHAGTAVILPARMGSGKTTLVAALVRAGMRYVTDEAVAIDPETLGVHPYPKALSLGAGSWDLLPDLRPAVDAATERYLESTWHVDPLGIRPDAIAPPCTPGIVVAPRYTEGARSELVPMSRAEALGALARNAFNLAAYGRRGLETLAAVVRRCDCYRLPVGDLDEACRLVWDLVERHAAAGGVRRDH